MQVAESFSNVPRRGHLDITPKALYILAQSSTPDEVREDAIAMAVSGAEVGVLFCLSFDTDKKRPA